MTLMQDPGFVADDYTGPLQPGWLEIQWIKINNLTSTLVNNPFYNAAQAVASGGGFGLRSTPCQNSTNAGQSMARIIVKAEQCICH